MKCPPFEELMCDPDCETMEFVTSKCGCASMKCVPIDDKTVPVCDKCHEAKKRMVEKCGREKWECVPKRVSYIQGYGSGSGWLWQPLPNR